MAPNPRVVSRLSPSLSLIGCLLPLFILSLTALFPYALESVQKHPADLLDNLTCTGPAAASLQWEASPSLSIGSWEQLPCVDASSVNLLASSKDVQAGNILLLVDIDDTLIASGGWHEVMGRSLGGLDSRYGRGSDYPGFGAVLFLLALGPHARNLRTGQLTEYSLPSKIMLVTARPNLPLFRPDHLVPHVSTILARGARQIMGDEAPEWGVGSQNSMRPANALRGMRGRGENKLSYMVSVLSEGQPVAESRVDEQTKVMFIGDTAERDLEVAVGLTAMAPEKMIAHFLHVVYAHNVADPTQLHAPSQSAPEKLDEDWIVNKVSQVLQDVFSGAARTAAAVTRALKEKDEREKKRGAPSRAPPESPQTNKQKVSVHDALGNTTRFGIKVGNALVDAIAIVYDVLVTSDDEEGPRRCTDLSAADAFEVGVLVAQKVRLILDLYQHRWHRTYAAFRAQEEGEAAGSAVPPRMLPVIFVQCGSVKLRVAHDARPQAPLDAYVSEMQGGRSRVSVRFRGTDTLKAGNHVDAESLQSNMLDSLGIPIVPFVTSISAVAQAYVLGTVDLTDVLVVVRKTYESLRSQGPLAQPARLPALLDHYYDLLSLRALLFPGGREALPPDAPARVRATVDYLDELVKVQKAFVKRSAYLRAVPDRTESCIRELEQIAETQYERSLRQRASGDREGVSFSRSQFVAFTTAFGELVCPYDVELSSVHFAGGAEVQGLAVYVSRFARQALSAADTAAYSKAESRKATHESSANHDTSAERVEGSSAEAKDVTKGQAACPLPVDVRATFAAMYEAFCAEVAGTVCRLLESRLLSSGVLADFIFLAQERGKGNAKPLRLPHLGRVVFADEQGLEAFEMHHRKPVRDVFGSLGSKLDEAIMEQAASGFSFTKWPFADSWSRWKHVAGDLQLIVDCDLLTHGKP